MNNWASRRNFSASFRSPANMVGGLPMSSNRWLIRGGWLGLGACGVIGEGIGEGMDDEDRVLGLGGSDFIITSAALNSDSCWGVLGIFMHLRSEG